MGNSEGGFGFAIFEALRPQSLRPDEVSVAKTNVIISQHFKDRHFAGVRRVVLLFNVKGREIGIRPAEDKEVGYTLSGRSISAKSFYAYFGIAPEERGRLLGRIEDGMLIISLKDHERSTSKINSPFS